MRYRLVTQGCDAVQDAGYASGLVALASMSGIGLIWRVAFQQQVFQRHAGYDPTKSLGAIIGNRAADAEMEADLPQVLGLLLATREAVNHATKTTMSAHRESDLLDRVAGMNDDGKVLFPGQLELSNEIVPLRIRVQVRVVKVQANLSDSNGSRGLQP